MTTRLSETFIVSCNCMLLNSSMVIFSFVVRMENFEISTPGLQSRHSASELHPDIFVIRMIRTTPLPLIVRLLDPNLDWDHRLI